jgi:dTDP-4-dehydrorhamnose 3,5-epimerase-like enzyme
MKIVTKDSQGRENGWLCPIWNVLDGPKVDQVYLTVIFAGMMKGPHLHLRRRGLFKVVTGNVFVVCRVDDSYSVRAIDVNSEPVPVAPGVPCALYNRGTVDAYVLNMPSPSWSPEDEDEHEVVGWDFKL